MPAVSGRRRSGNCPKSATSRDLTHATAAEIRPPACRSGRPALQRAGLQPGQSVAIMLPTSPGYFPTYLGILPAGGIPVPI